VLTTDSFNSKQMSYAMIGEFILAVLVTQMDVFNARHGPDQPAPVRVGAGSRRRPPAAVGTWQIRGPAPDEYTIPIERAGDDPGRSCLITSCWCRVPP